MPENNLNLEDGFITNGMTEEDFNSIIDSVEAVYKPIVEQFGGNLIIHREWTNSTVNAYAERNGVNWEVSMFGGLARRSEITHDGFAMVLAHEIGHHIAGYPFVSDWAANEGNSDYFAFIAASKLVWGNGITDSEVNPDAKKLCDEYAKNKAQCYRQMNAGYSLANLLGALGGTKVSFKTPDKTIVKKTNNEHPAAQCRLDTYVAGTLCNVEWDSNVIPQNEAEMGKQSCVSAKGKDYDLRSRSRCWYKPTK